MLVTVYASETLEVSFSQIRAPRGEVGREKTILRSWKVGKWNENYITVRQLLLFNIWELSSTVFFNSSDSYLTLLLYLCCVLHQQFIFFFRTSNQTTKQSKWCVSSKSPSKTEVKCQLDKGKDKPCIEWRTQEEKQNKKILKPFVHLTTQAPA